jgi:hypothetical protein
MTIGAVIVLGGGGDPSVLTNGSPPGDASAGGIVTRPGQVADFPITVESARLVPLPGYATPRLVHLGVLAEHDDLLTSARGWPIPKGSTASAGYYTMRPLHGSVVLPWQERRRRHLGPMPDMVEFGVLGTGSGRYFAAAGLDLTYRLGGNTYTQRLYAGAEDCVWPGFTPQLAKSPKLNPCFAFQDRAGNAVFALAAHG